MFHLNIFESSADVVPFAASWLDQTRLALLEPFFAGLRASPARAPTGRTQFGEPGGQWVKLEAGPTMEASSLYRFSPRHWFELLDCVRAGGCSYFELSVYPLDESGYPDCELGGCTLILNLREAQPPNTLSRLHLAVDRAAYPDAAFGSLQERWVQFAKAAAQDLGAAYGYITLDFAGPDETPYEDWMGIDWVEGAAASAMKARGYYWGNFWVKDTSRSWAALIGFWPRPHASGSRTSPPEIGSRSIFS